MLVLTRKAMETIKIGDDIVFKILCTGTKSVRMASKRRETSAFSEANWRNTAGPAERPADFVQPFVADAVTDTESMEEPVIVGPMTAEKFLAEFTDVLPGRSIRRMLKFNGLR